MGLQLLLHVIDSRGRTLARKIGRLFILAGTVDEVSTRRLRKGEGGCGGSKIAQISNFELILYRFRLRLQLLVYICRGVVEELRNVRVAHY